MRATWKPRGANGRWEFYVEVINILNRKNAGQLRAELAYEALVNCLCLLQVRHLRITAHGIPDLVDRPVRPARCAADLYLRNVEPEVVPAR